MEHLESRKITLEHLKTILYEAHENSGRDEVLFHGKHVTLLNFMTKEILGGNYFNTHAQKFKSKSPERMTNKEKARLLSPTIQTILVNIWKNIIKAILQEGYFKTLLFHVIQTQGKDFEIYFQNAQSLSVCKRVSSSS